MSKPIQPISYSERVLPGMNFFLAALFIPAALFLVTLPFSGELAIAIACASYFAVVLLSYWSAPLISIQLGVLTISQASIPLATLGSAEVISPKEQFKVKGRELNPLSFTRFQIGVKGLVKITVVDQTDPTPYWLVATRNPELLAAYLNAQR